MLINFIGFNNYVDIEIYQMGILITRCYKVLNSICLDLNYGGYSICVYQNGSLILHQAFIYKDNLPITIINPNNLIINRVFTLTDYHYKNLPIEKGTINLWPQT